MYEKKRIWIKKDAVGKELWKNLLLASSLVPDDQVDFTLGIYCDDKLIGTGSLYKNIIKLVAVAESYQNENLLTTIIMSLSSRLREEGQTHFFLYTSPSSASSFQSLGFTEIVRTENLVFMEQGFPDFSDYENVLRSHKKMATSAGAIVMNANPFTNGHLYLIERAAQENDVVYLFVLSENYSEFSTTERMKLVKAGTKHIKQVVVLPTKDYQVSAATFPSYFLKDQAQEHIAQVQARMDATLFKDKISPILGIQTRYVGEEPFSPVTELYNRSMKEVFSDEITLTIIPRLEVKGQVVSATKVRKLLQENHLESIRELVPSTTFTYLKEKK